MTKFEGEAIGVRGGRQKGGLPTQKERKKEMELYMKTGVHSAHEVAKNRPMIPSLPERDPHRPHVFMEFRVGQNTLGRVLIEVFEDRVPLAARYFLNRCREGTSDSFQGAKVHRLVPELGVFGGLSKGHRDGSASIKRNQYLQHIEHGTVSISNSGSEYVLALSRALTLNATHQVVGRVHAGQEVLEQLNGATTADEQPQPAVVLAACGLTNARGEHEGLEESLAAEQKKATPEETARQLQAQALQARAATKEALQAALSQKRKPKAPAQPASKAQRVYLQDDALDEDLSSSGSEQEVALAT